MIIAFEENYAMIAVPQEIIDSVDGYYNCNFSFKTPLEIDGKKVGIPLDIKALFVECNLTNREPHPEAELIRCNTTIADVEISERIEVDRTAEIESSSLPNDLKKLLPKIIAERRIITPHKVYGKFDIMTRKYVYKEIPK